MDAGLIVAVAFIAVLALIVFSVVRGLWRIFRGEPELEAGGSWGLQLFSRRRVKS